MKRCSRCGEANAAAQYRKGCRQCRRCRNAASRAWNHAHPGYQRNWEKAHPARNRAAQRARRIAQSGRIKIIDRENDLKKYGLTIASFSSILASQNGGCAACGGPANGKGQTFHVDHDHNSGEIRGLLCHSCNTALGLMKDNVGRLQCLISYLTQKREGVA